MTKRTTTSNHTVAKAMELIFKSDEVKGSFFSTTPPDAVDNIIDNLSTSLKSVPSRFELSAYYASRPRWQLFVTAPVPDFTAATFFTVPSSSEQSSYHGYSSVYPRH
jgi:hypothetical protein